MTQLMQPTPGPSPMPTPGPNAPFASPPPPPRRLQRRGRAELGWGLLFLGPNLLGFLVFTLVPLVMSLTLAFSNWDLRLHNMFKPDAHVRFVGLGHFARLLGDANFWHYLGNTLFFMIGLPIGIALSLLSAIVLSQDLRGGGPNAAGGRKAWGVLIAGAVLVASAMLLAAVGLGGSGLTVLLTGVVSLILVGGTLGGQTVYRTLFYIPNFTAGVATMLLWKKMYNPISGPINDALAGPIRLAGATFGRLPQGVATALMLVGLALAALLCFACMRRLMTLRRDGDVGTFGIAIAAVALALPAYVCGPWMPSPAYAIAFAALTAVAIVAAIASVGTRRSFRCSQGEGVGTALMLSLAATTGAIAIAGLAVVLHRLPAMTAAGLAPPSWLQDPAWAKPALMVMGLWGAVGSQTMLLYLAALTNVPGELYEAADIDGATGGQKFWSVTWPQLAPTTFFVVVMGVIAGLQGGFEMARVMTLGGPAGSTTTLAYFIYQEGLETGRLGFSSAVSWTMFLLVLVVTLFNWKFGGRYVND